MLSIRKADGYLIARLRHRRGLLVSFASQLLNSNTTSKLSKFTLGNYLSSEIDVRHPLPENGQLLFPFNFCSKIISRDISCRFIKVELFQSTFGDICAPSVGSFDEAIHVLFLSILKSLNCRRNEHDFPFLFVYELFAPFR
jgi:hypothetical protein